MKYFFTILVLLFFLTMFSSCNKDDDSSQEPEAVVCEMWFEGDPCEAMISKFIGDYEGGAGFCGTDYEYTVIATPNIVNGIAIGIANPGQPETYFFNAVLKSSTEFDIPLQEVEANGQISMLSGDGNLNGTTLSYHLIVVGAGECDHVATKIN